MGSAIGPTIDYLLDLADRATVNVAGMIVTDGWPSGAGDALFGVGADRPPLDTTGEQAVGTAGILTMGNVGIEENFGVDHYIFSGQGGTDQKARRDAVLAVYDTWLSLLRADLLATPCPLPCLVAMVTNLGLEGPKSQEEAADGRYSLLTFTVMCKNLI